MNSFVKIPGIRLKATNNFPFMDILKQLPFHITTVGKVHSTIFRWNAGSDAHTISSIPMSLRYDFFSGNLGSPGGAINFAGGLFSVSREQVKPPPRVAGVLKQHKKGVPQKFIVDF